MTGRRLYDLACDARAAVPRSVWDDKPQYLPNEMVAWPFLHGKERTFWNDLAKRVTPTRRPKTAACS